MPTAASAAGMEVQTPTALAPSAEVAPTAIDLDSSQLALLEVFIPCDDIAHPRHLLL